MSEALVDRRGGDPDAILHASYDDATTVVLPTGTLTLRHRSDAPVQNLCDFAARANPRRGFLIVSKVLGRHLPARPTAMRASMRGLAQLLPADLSGPVCFLGMAETATALGQGVFAAHLDRRGGDRDVYLQSSRQQASSGQILATFEEGHSHATTHLIQTGSRQIEEAVGKARTLVIVDDESSTGRTFVAAAHALRPHLPRLERVHTLCITDWSGGGYLGDMPAPSVAHSLLSGSLEWRSEPTSCVQPARPMTGHAPSAPLNGMGSRTGIMKPDLPRREHPAVHPGRRYLVLGEQEHAYEALVVAEEIERAGGIAAVQCVTRSPALLGGAMRTATELTDSYGSGAPCFVYNLLAHRPDEILVTSEIRSTLLEELEAETLRLGRRIPIRELRCRYDER